jgi:hypothetical protein
MKTRIVGIVLIAVVSIALLFTIALRFFPSLFQPSSIKQLQSVEVRQYQGENLSSVGDFIENSIKGPQYVDMTK